MDELGDPYTCEGLEKIDATVVTLRAYLERARMCGLGLVNKTNGAKPRTHNGRFVLVQACSSG
jgi:hypothetical protein